MLLNRGNKDPGYYEYVITRETSPEVLLVRSKASLVAGLVTGVIGINSVEIVEIHEMVSIQALYFRCGNVYDCHVRTCFLNGIVYNVGTGHYTYIVVVIKLSTNTLRTPLKLLEPVFRLEL